MFAIESTMIALAFLTAIALGALRKCARALADTVPFAPLPSVMKV